MPIIACHQCNARINVPEDTFGKRIRCPLCGMAFEVAPVVRGMWQTVDISARLVSWPEWCACCLVKADSKVTVSHTRYSGIKVVHSEDKGWNIPYCVGCLTHIDDGKESSSRINEWIIFVENTKTSFDRERYNVENTTIPEPISMDVHLKLCFIMSFVFILLSVPVSSIVARPGAKIFAAMIVFMSIATLAAVIAGVVVILAKQRDDLIASTQRRLGLLKKSCQRLWQELKKAEHDSGVAIAALEANARRFVKPTCVSADLSVAYDGWKGSVHTFRFYNPKFMDEFKRLNEKKIV